MRLPWMLARVNLTGAAESATISAMVTTQRTLAERLGVSRSLVARASCARRVGTVVEQETEVA